VDGLRGGDACARKYLERCEAIRRSPPGREWDGLFEMETGQVGDRAYRSAALRRDDLRHGARPADSLTLPLETG
jgi:hypothetical protein